MENLLIIAGSCNVNEFYSGGRNWTACCLLSSIYWVIGNKKINFLFSCGKYRALRPPFQVLIVFVNQRLKSTQFWEGTKIEIGNAVQLLKVPSQHDAPPWSEGDYFWAFKFMVFFFEKFLRNFGKYFFIHFFCKSDDRFFCFSRSHFLKITTGIFYRVFFMSFYTHS